MFHLLDVPYFLNMEHLKKNLCLIKLIQNIKSYVYSITITNFLIKEKLFALFVIRFPLTFPQFSVNTVAII